MLGVTQGPKAKFCFYWKTQACDMEGEGQDLVLTSSLLMTQPSHAQSSELLLIHNASTPQHFSRALAPTQIIKF